MIISTVSIISTVWPSEQVRLYYILWKVLILHKMICFCPYLYFLFYYHCVFISLKQDKLQFFQNVSIISTVQRTSCKSDRYTYCLYYKYCLENFENVSIIRPVQRQFQEHYKYKYCLYYKYCFSYIKPFSWIIAMFKALRYSTDTFW